VMANQIAIRLQSRPGDEVICHAVSHIYDHEYSGAAAISGVMLRPLDSVDGTLPLDRIADRFRLAAAGRSPQVALICLENTHNDRGGLVLPEGHPEAVAKLARAHGAAMHLDGARLFNAAVASGRSLASLAAPFDTVNVCMSKGLGAPVGSLLVGSRAHCEQAVRIRRYLGGLMRQSGVLAGAARYALAHHVTRLADDHRRAAALGRALA
ncbi:MAG: low specificity L-threonine aldolase, partial [Bosea sp.]|uniref:threonine aldolase family protein n=1 Tax=Bosea sp. (in: a-proteobacteria) TaxID=1871050 RepID=UPI00239225DC|nr:low specificity L-threonine aldolase [Bosea sp. (in: a-proteobacteria)]